MAPAPAAPAPYQPPTASQPTVPAPQAPSAAAPVQHEPPAPRAPVGPPAQAAPAARVDLGEDVPTPIPARPVTDPGPFAAPTAAAPPAEVPRPLSADPFAGTFHPSGETPYGQPTAAVPPMPVQPPPLAETYTRPGPEGLARPAGPVEGAARSDYQVPDAAATRGAFPNRQVGEAPFPVPENAVPHESKSFVATWLLAWFLGNLGVDRFYLGKIGTGIVKLVTAGGLGVWALYDLFLTLLGHQTAKDGSLLAGYDEHKRLAWIVTLGVWLVAAAAYVAVAVFGVIAVNLPSL